jgi:hypothetical protein
VPLSWNPYAFLSGNYNAEVHYWIYLYVDGNGTLQGYVDWYNCTVQSGPHSGSIATQLQILTGESLSLVDSLISEALTAVNAVSKYRSVYYLPGLNASSGNTNDGVSVVLIKNVE